MLYVGTAGFSYSDWRGPFYPGTMKQSEFLEYYARVFPCVELDYTYYRQPVPKTMMSMVKRVTASFRFAVKAHRTLTHRIASGETFNKEVNAFLSGVEPMAEAGNLACILFQFPWSYHFTPQNLEYVLSLKKRLPVAPPVIEFRNREWARDDVYAALREYGLSFCCVDEPDLRTLFPRMARVTANPGYVRFHGRNAEKWFRHTEAWERYDYLYNDDELRSWIPAIGRMSRTTEDTYVVFNNCHRGQAARNALRMQELLLQDPNEQQEIESGHRS